MTMPAWLESLLIDKGVLTAQGLSRKAKVVIHRDCGLPTVAGFDADRCALDAWCDPAQLTADGEAWALLDGRATYELRVDRLERRDRWTIPGRPPSHELPVLAAHRCHAPIPAAWRLPPAPATLTRPTEGF